ncbi:hypothetical protein BV96_04683 [Sphingomonas paucimobilis]|nr:hypothetical protein BV96_04683 [Sphingomonas paucimobilis]
MKTLKRRSEAVLSVGAARTIVEGQQWAGFSAFLGNRQHALRVV